MTNYWLPSWWGWIDNWDACSTCLEYNGSPCVSCEIPPGMLGLACLVGGGTTAVAGNLRGNATIVSDQQAVAAARVSGTEAVTRHLDQQRNRTLDVNVDESGALDRRLNR